jgi:hypothetical protein
MKTLAVAAFLAMAGGSAFAAETAMKMGCCEKCSCCKDMKGDKPDHGKHQGHQDHQQHQPKQ